MRAFFLPLVAVVALSACAGGGERSACEVFTPPPAASPSAQSGQDVDAGRVPQERLEAGEPSPVC